MWWWALNDHLYDPAKYPIVTAASCTTNCLPPVVKVVHEAIGIRHGQITTIHDPTNTNVVTDAPHKDLRRARSAMLSLQPTTTGSATANAHIYPELKGKLNGHAARAPVLTASRTKCVFELRRETSAEEVNDLFMCAAAGPLAGILGYETRPLVSVDYAGDTRSSIIDAPSTLVTDGTMLKVYAWYDNVSIGESRWPPCMPPRWRHSCADSYCNLTFHRCLSLLWGVPPRWG